MSDIPNIKSAEILDDYFLKDAIFVEDNIVVLVKPREQYTFSTNEVRVTNEE